MGWQEDLDRAIDLEAEQIEKINYKKQTNMKTATSKIKQVVKTKDHTGNYGTTIYHDLVMENGDKIQIGKKKLQQVGWELSYQITEQGQQEYQPAKSIKPEEVQGASQTNNQPQNQNKGVNVQNLIVAQSCLSSACTLLQQSVDASSESAIAVAEKFYQFVMSKG